jgi:pyrrolidone-carboxylate peptidase
MESKNSNLNKFKKLNLYLTGYGPFYNVTENPSQKLIESLVADKAKIESTQPDKVELKYHQIFEVNCDHVSNNITGSYELIDTCGEGVMNLIIHFGVYGGGRGILLEKQCQNYIVDYVNRNEKICKMEKDFNYCKLNLDDMCSKLKEKGHSVNTSTNAGTYLCNYIYFLTSSKFKECDNTYSVFIHIPPIKEIDVEGYKAMVCDFLKEIADSYIE